MKRAVIVIPTYNEAKNITRLLQAINLQRFKNRDTELLVLVVDDSSPDGTADLVRTFADIYPFVHLLADGAKEGLGMAYIRGFEYALNELEADIVFEMDADFSHDPGLIPYFIREIEEGADFVIGSRYIPGGSIPSEWPVIRKLNSKYGNIFARYIAGLTDIKDCTSGYRAITKEVLKKIDFSRMNVKGYSFQMNLLHKAYSNGAVISEIPLRFVDRVFGESKIRFSDITEFIVNSIFLGFPIIKFLVTNMHYLAILFALFSLIFFFNAIGIISTSLIIYTLITIFFSLLIVQGVFSLYWMLFAWEDIEQVEKAKPPTNIATPLTSFTALLPARHEKEVIGDTIRAISEIDYPENLKEVLIICRIDDVETIIAAQRAIDLIGKTNIRVITFDGFPINKPHGLNFSLPYATHDVVVVFDAEDQPHKDIYKIVNTVFLDKGSDVIQAGVQLMNFRSNWFSTLNVLEYYFWFKSAMHFFAGKGIVPLGGNTVFFKKNMLKKVGGWDQTCLTEDADIGIRLSVIGAKIDVVYDERIVTQEETPTDLASFIKQRTRWNQGFLQILFKGDYLYLSTWSERLLAFYILILPEILGLLFLFLPISLLMLFTVKLPIVLALIAFTPLFILVLMLITCSVGLYLFCKDFKLKFPLWMPIKVFYTAYPFFIILGISSFRAIFRMLLGNFGWEKTLHINAHRNNSPRGVSLS